MDGSFEIRPTDGTIISTLDKYIGNTSNSNSLSASDDELTNTFNIPTENNTNNNVDIVSSGGAYLRYNKTSGQERFRYFKSSTYTSQQPIALYKYDATEAPFATAKFNASGYATFSSAAKIDLNSTSDFTAWQITNISSENAITFVKVTSVVPAGTGLLLQGTAGEVAVLSVTDASASALSGNKLVGIAEATTIADNYYYGLSGATFVKVNGGKVPAGKALLPASLVGETGVKAFNFVFEDDATSIEHSTLNIEHSAAQKDSRKRPVHLSACIIRERF